MVNRLLACLVLCALCTLVCECRRHRSHHHRRRSEALEVPQPKAKGPGQARLFGNGVAFPWLQPDVNRELKCPRSCMYVEQAMASPEFCTQTCVETNKAEKDQELYPRPRRNYEFFLPTSTAKERATGEDLWEPEDVVGRDTYTRAIHNRGLANSKEVTLDLFRRSFFSSILSRFKNRLNAGPLAWDYWTKSFARTDLAVYSKVTELEESSTPYSVNSVSVFFDPATRSFGISPAESPDLRALGAVIARLTANVWAALLADENVKESAIAFMYAKCAKYDFIESDPQRWEPEDGSLGEKLGTLVDQFANGLMCWINAAVWSSFMNVARSEAWGDSYANLTPWFDGPSEAFQDVADQICSAVGTKDDALLGEHIMSYKALPQEYRDKLATRPSYD